MELLALGIVVAPLRNASPTQAYLVLSSREEFLVDSRALPGKEFKDLDLNDIPGLRADWEAAKRLICRYYNDGGTGDAEIDIKGKCPLGKIEAVTTVKLPHDEKFPKRTATWIRENGTLRLEKPAEQEKLFK